MRSVSFNVLNRKVHYWASFIVAVPLAVMIASGILLQAKKQVAWVQPAEQLGTGTEPRISLDRILEQVMSVPELGVTGWSDVDRFDLRPGKGVVKVLLENRWEVQVDLGTGAVLQTAYRRSDLIESIHDGSFFGGDWTKLGLFLPTGITLLLLWLGGMWMWWVPYIGKRRHRASHKAEAPVPVSRLRGFVAAALASSAVAACGGPPPEAGADDAPAATAIESAAYLPLAGYWETLPDGEIIGDATKWDSHPRPDAAANAERLFGTAPPELFANLNSPGAFPIAVSTAIPGFEGGTLAVEFNLLGGESDQIAGLLFDLRPTGEYHYVRYNTRDDDVALWRFANGDRENLAHGTGKRRLPLEAWHPLTVTIDGPRLTATAAGDLRLEYTLDAPVDGRVGVWTKRDSITGFRNLRVQ